MHGDCVSATAPELREHSAIGVHLALFWGCPPNPPLPRGRRPLTYQGRRSPPLRAGFWTLCSLALKAQAHVGAGRLTRKRLSYRPPLRECSLRSLRGSLRIPGQIAPSDPRLAGWNLGQSRVSREPESPPIPRPPAPASFEVGRPEGVHVDIRRSPGGALVCNPELILEFT